MPRRPSFKPLLTSDGWMVSIPESMSGTGSRKKRYFEQERDAKAFAAKLRGDYHTGLRGGTISPELAAMAAQAASILEPFNLTLLDAAKLIAKQHSAIGSSETFRERWMAYQLQQEAHWGSVYSFQFEWMQNWLSKDFMELRVSAITPDVIASELKRYAKSTAKRRTAMINSVLSGRGKERRAEKIEILTRSQCIRLIAGARGKKRERDRPENKGALWTVALLLFAGIRPGADEGEISRLDWADFKRKEIYLPSSVTKTGSDRHIPITPILARLIKGHPKSGGIIPAGWVRRWTRIRKRAGISSKNDICRHTFASHFLAVYGENDTKAALGHTRGSDTLFAYYRRSVTKEAGRKYFGLDKPQETR